MRTMPYPIQTVNLGMSAQMGAFLVAGGTKGMRYALPNSRFAMVNPSLDPPYDNEGKPIFRRMQATEMQLEAEEVLRDKKRMLEGFSEFTGRSVDVLRSDFKRDFYLSANEALEYGLVDKILMPKNPNKNSGRGELTCPPSSRRASTCPRPADPPSATMARRRWRAATACARRGSGTAGESLTVD